MCWRFRRAQALGNNLITEGVYADNGIGSLPAQEISRPSTASPPHHTSEKAAKPLVVGKVVQYPPETGVVHNNRGIKPTEVPEPRSLVPSQQVNNSDFQLLIP